MKPRKKDLRILISKISAINYSKCKLTLLNSHSKQNPSDTWNSAGKRRCHCTRKKKKRKEKKEGHLEKTEHSRWINQNQIVNWIYLILRKINFCTNWETLLIGQNLVCCVDKDDVHTKLIIYSALNCRKKQAHFVNSIKLSHKLAANACDNSPSPPAYARSLLLSFWSEKAPHFRHLIFDSELCDTANFTLYNAGSIFGYNEKRGIESKLKWLRC